jgi:hypothetical protein
MRKCFVLILHGYIRPNAFFSALPPSLDWYIDDKQGKVKMVRDHLLFRLEWTKVIEIFILLICF